MARITQSTNTLTAPAWAGDFISREHLLAGGAKLNAADFTAGGDGYKTVVSGTLVGRTYAERDAGTGFGVAADADDEFYLVAFDVKDAATMNDVELYRHGGLVKENFLPVFSGLSATQKAKVRALYETTTGVN